MAWNTAQTTFSHTRETIMNKEYFAARRAFLLEFFVKQRDFASARANEEWTKLLETERIHLHACKLILALVGECKSGKSSTANGLMGALDLSPVNAAVSTNALIQFAHGDRERMVVYRTVGENKVEEEVSRTEIADWVSEQGNPGNVKKVDRIDIFLPNEFLKNGLVLWDLPGLGGFDRNHSIVTLFALQQADAALFINTAQRPIGESHLPHIRRAFANARKVFYVLTHRDAVSNWRERLADDLATIADALKVPPGTINGCAISNELRAESFTAEDSWALDASGYPELFAAIQELLQEKEKHILARALYRAAEANHALLVPIDTAIQALEESSQEKRARQGADLAARLERANALRSGNARWIQDLMEHMQTLDRDASHELELMFADLDTNLQRYLTIESYLRSPEDLGAELTADCSTGFGAILDFMRARLERIVEKLHESTDLDLRGGTATLGEVASLTVQPVIAPNPESALKKASDVGRSMTIHGMGVGAAGSIIGAIVGGVLGTIGAGPAGLVTGAHIGAGWGGALSGFIGSIFGIKRGVADVRERELGLLRNSLGLAARASLGKARIDLRHQIQQALAETRAGLREEMISGIERDMKIQNDSIAALKAASETSQAEVAAELRKLRNDKKLLEQWRKQLDEMFPGDGGEQPEV